MFNDFEISYMSQSGVFMLFLEKENIELDPEFQREGDIWPDEKKQLLMDSIINGYDIPKIYFRKYSPPIQKKGKLCKYAIIDGKQRLTAIWDFMDGKFALSDEILYRKDIKIKLNGLFYKDLAQKYPNIKGKFDSTNLPVVLIYTEEDDIIEEIFSRLNFGVSLSAAEFRNSLGGPLPQVIKTLASHKFFKNHVPFGNKRYRHYDISAKFLYLEHKKTICDTSKYYLDAFVREFKGKKSSTVAPFLEKSEKRLSDMTDVFSLNDPLLKSLGMVTVYYLLFLQHMALIDRKKLRPILLSFNDDRRENRKKAEEDITKANFELLEFDRFVQSPNDAAANSFRLKVLAAYVKKKMG